MGPEEKILHRYRSKVAAIRGGIVHQVAPLHNITQDAVGEIQALIDKAREEGRQEAYLFVEGLCIKRTNIDPKKEPDDVSLAMTELKVRVELMRKTGRH